MTIFLPVSLALRWKIDDPRLVNLFHLVSAVKLVTNRRLAPTDPTTLHNHMLSYLRGIPVLFPYGKILPNHHFALHLSELASLFGPLPTLAAWSGERVNYLLARVPTNHHPGAYLIARPSLSPHY